MSDRHEKPVRAGLAIAALLLAAQFKVSMASAQEAILLETIGAVRMAPPDEIQRMDAEQKGFRALEGQRRSATQSVEQMNHPRPVASSGN